MIGLDCLAATTTLEEATRRRWDVAVVGAGPAGAIAALELARRGASVLLIDKAAFPRPKICGCCLNGAALTTLAQCGLSHLPERLSAPRLRAVRLSVGGRTATLPLPTGAALSREAFDAALVAEAIHAGVAFLPKTSATLESVPGEVRRVRLRAGARHGDVGAKIVLAADGLGGRCLRRFVRFAVHTTRNARIGAGTIVSDPPSFYTKGTVFMTCGRGGYVGLVRLQDNRLNVAAAFDTGFVRTSRGLNSAAASILAEAGVPPVADLRAARWRGTPPLTCRRSQLAAERVFVIGDAAGYVEPFTGEGMAWALASGMAVVPLVCDALRAWDPALAACWEEQHRVLFRRSQLVCRVTMRLLRRPRLIRAVLVMLGRFPGLARPYLGAINAGSHQSASVTARPISIHK